MRKVFLAAVTALVTTCSAPAPAQDIGPLPPDKVFPERAIFSIVCGSEGSAKNFVDDLPLSVQIISGVGSYENCFVLPITVPISELDLLYSYSAPEPFPDAIISVIEVDNGKLYWVPLNSAVMVDAPGSST